jgi:hypothetical protein
MRLGTATLQQMPCISDYDDGYDDDSLSEYEANEQAEDQFMRNPANLVAELACLCCADEELSLSGVDEQAIDEASAPMLLAYMFNGSSLKLRESALYRLRELMLASAAGVIQEAAAELLKGEQQ